MSKDDDQQPCQSVQNEVSFEDVGRHDVTKRHDQFELLIFSEAGKPIYSYTKRDDAVTLMPLCSALINYAKKAQKETLKSIKTSDNLVIHFTTRSPLIIIVIHGANSFVEQSMLVDQVEAQVISILTAKTLNSLFEERPTFDLKRLLYGSEKLIDSTTNLCAFPRRLRSPWVEPFLAVNSPSRPADANTSSNTAKNASLTSTKPHRLLIPLAIIPSQTRDSIHNILQNVIASNSKNMVFSLLFRLEPYKKTDSTDISTADGEDEDLSTETTTTNASLSEDCQEVSKELESTDLEIDFKLVTLCNHHERHKIKTADIHIILALLSGSRAQLDSVESLWMPICLPKFNQDAFLHSYIAYTNDGRFCIIMMSIDRDEFANCQRARNTIDERLSTLMTESSHKNKFHYRPSPLINPALLSLQDRLVNLQRGVSESEEAIKIQKQMLSFKTKQDLFQARQLQFLWYQTGRHVLWWQRSSRNSANSVVYYVTKKMLQASLKHLWLKLSDGTVILGLHGPTFQLYAQFDSTITTNEATEVIQRITSWIKREEDNFSIKDYR